MDIVNKKLHDIEVDAYQVESVVIEPTAIEEEFVRLPADLAYWNEKYARAYKAQLIAEAEVKRSYAKLDLEIRSTAAAAGKKITEGQVEQTVVTSQEYQDALLTHIDSQAELKRIYGICDALRSKKEMLISYGAHVRAEMDGDPLLKEQHRARRVREG